MRKTEEQVSSKTLAMVRLTKTTAFFLCTCALVQIAKGQQFHVGIPVDQLSGVSRLLPPISDVEAVKIFQDLKQQGSLVALLVGLKHGRELFIVSPHKSKQYAVRWHSSLLAGSLDVISFDPLKLETLNDGDAISFSGCAQHMCPDIFSTLLYVPSQNRAFVGTCDRGTTHYDFVLDASHEEVRSVLERRLRDADHYGNAHACSPEGKH